MLRPGRRAALLLIAAFPAAFLTAQTRPKLSVDWITGPEAELATKLPRFAWTGSTLLLLDESRPAAERTFERVDPAGGTRRPALDRAAALASLRAVVPEKDLPEAFTWPASLDGAGTTAVYAFGGDLFALDFAASRFERLSQTDAREKIPRLSPDGRRIAFVRDNDLYVFDRASGAERRVTSDGSPTVLNGVPSYIYWEEILHHDESGYWWSPDSRAIAFLRSDDSGVDVATFTDFRPFVPEVVTQRYPRAGRPNPTVRLGVADLDTGGTSWMDVPAPGYEYILRVQWLPDSRSVAAQTTNRAQDRLELYAVGRSDGQTRRLLTEADSAWVNQKEAVFLENGEFLVSSERSGHTHLYRYRADGSFGNAVTHGDWSVRGPGAFYAAPMGSAVVDEGRGLVYFTGLEKSPIERHLYRIGLDGTGAERLTREDGTHRVTFSPDRRFYVDAHSSHATLPSLTVHDASGERTTVLAASRREILAPFAFPKPELRTVPARDGFPLPARILKPRGFNARVRHPVILRVYGGPGVPTVTDAWGGGNALFDQLLADRGYVVASIDNRSATGASKLLENTVLRNLWGGTELDDLVAGVRWLKAQPWVDPERVGIWGSSGGGTFTLNALTRSKEFRAGISVAPVTDWRFYDSKATEAYMKTPEENPEGYARTSLVSAAKDLHGRLLLVFGTYDDNVHPQNSWAFIDALVAAGLPFDMMAYPMRKHGIADRAARVHLYEKMLEFWKQNL